MYMWYLGEGKDDTIEIYHNDTHAKHEMIPCVPHRSEPSAFVRFADKCAGSLQVYFPLIPSLASGPVCHTSQGNQISLVSKPRGRSGSTNLILAAQCVHDARRLFVCGVGVAPLGVVMAAG